MITSIHKFHKTLSCRILSAFTAFAFISGLVLPPTSVSAEVILNLPAPGTMVSPSAAFMPAMINGITIHPENPLEFDFIVGTGDQKLQGKAFEEESTRLIKYFLAALTVPEDQMWVNLSPYEKDRIIPQSFGTTEMGRDLLAQDYILKQLTASLMYPEKELGSAFWKKIYQKAKEQYGTTEIPMNTFNKVWIVPEKAIVYEHGNSAFVVKSRLKVMLEKDYLAESQGHQDTKSPEGDAVTTEIIREIILPEIEKEVNEGRTFANLRQIYNSVILAAWFKQNFKQTLLGQVYVDQAKTEGVDVEDKTVNQKIYERYLEAFKKGVYNYIKEDIDPVTRGVIPRKYFSGGTEMKVSHLVETYRTNGPLTREQQEVLGEYLAGQKKYNGGKVRVQLAELTSNTSFAEAQRLIEEAQRKTALARPLTTEYTSIMSKWFNEYNGKVPSFLKGAGRIAASITLMCGLGGCVIPGMMGESGHGAPGILLNHGIFEITREFGFSSLTVAGKRINVLDLELGNVEILRDSINQKIHFINRAKGKEGFDGRAFILIKFEEGVDLSSIKALSLNGNLGNDLKRVGIQLIYEDRESKVYRFTGVHSVDSLVASIPLDKFHVPESVKKNPKDLKGLLFDIGYTASDEYDMDFYLWAPLLFFSFETYSDNTRFIELNNPNGASLELDLNNGIEFILESSQLEGVEGQVTTVNLRKTPPVSSSLSQGEENYYKAVEALPLALQFDGGIIEHPASSPVTLGQAHERLAAVREKLVDPMTIANLDQLLRIVSALQEQGAGISIRIFLEDAVPLLDGLEQEGLIDDIFAVDDLVGRLEVGNFFQITHSTQKGGLDIMGRLEESENALKALENKFETRFGNPLAPPPSQEQDRQLQTIRRLIRSIQGLRLVILGDARKPLTFSMFSEFVGEVMAVGVDGEDPDGLLYDLYSSTRDLLEALMKIQFGGYSKPGISTWVQETQLAAGETFVVNLEHLISIRVGEDDYYLRKEGDKIIIIVARRAETGIYLSLGKDYYNDDNDLRIRLDPAQSGIDVRLTLPRGSETAARVLIQVIERKLTAEEAKELLATQERVEIADRGDGYFPDRGIWFESSGSMRKLIKEGMFEGVEINGRLKFVPKPAASRARDEEIASSPVRPSENLVKAEHAFNWPSRTGIFNVSIALNPQTREATFKLTRKNGEKSEAWPSARMLVLPSFLSATEVARRIAEALVREPEGNILRTINSVRGQYLGEENVQPLKRIDSRTGTLREILQTLYATLPYLYRRGARETIQLRIRDFDTNPLMGILETTALNEKGDVRAPLTKLIHGIELLLGRNLGKRDYQIAINRGPGIAGFGSLYIGPSYGTGFSKPVLVERLQTPWGPAADLLPQSIDVWVKTSVLRAKANEIRFPLKRLYSRLGELKTELDDLLRKDRARGRALELKRKQTKELRAKISSIEALINKIETQSARFDAAADEQAKLAYPFDKVFNQAVGLLHYEQEISEFLQVGRTAISAVRFEVEKPESEQSGAMLKFTFETTAGQKILHARFKHPDRSKDPGNYYVFFKAAEEGIFPPVTVIADTLIYLERPGGISLQELAAYNQTRVNAFLRTDQGRYFAQEIGRAIGRLNKRLGITVKNFSLGDIILTPDNGVYIMSLSPAEPWIPTGPNSDTDLARVKTYLKMVIESINTTGRIDRENVLPVRAQYAGWVEEGYNQINLMYYPPSFFPGSSPVQIETPEQGDKSIAVSSPVTAQDIREAMKETVDLFLEANNQDDSYFKINLSFVLDGLIHFIENRNQDSPLRPEEVETFLRGSKGFIDLLEDAQNQFYADKRSGTFRDQVLKPELTAVTMLFSPHLYASSPIKVLVVEDHRSTAILLEQIITLGLPRKHEVRIANRATEALKDWRSYGDVDLVITDQQMPEMSGEEFIPELRARGFNGPIIFNSSTITSEAKISELKERLKTKGVEEGVIVSLGKLIEVGAVQEIMAKAEPLIVKNKIKERVRNVIKETLEITKERRKESRGSSESLSKDSLDRIEFILQLEDEFAAELKAIGRSKIPEGDSSKFTEFKSIAEVVDYLQGLFAGASSSPIKKKEDIPGGIDLNPALLDLQIKRDGNGVPLPLPQQPIENMRIEGFIPIIINVTPVTNLPMLLGLADEETNPRELNPELKARELEKITSLN